MSLGPGDGGPGGRPGGKKHEMPTGQAGGLGLNPQSKGEPLGTDRQGVACLSDLAPPGGLGGLHLFRGCCPGARGHQTSRHLGDLISTPDFKGQETETGPGEGQRRQ